MIHPLLLISEKLKCRSETGEAVYLYLNLDIIPDSQIITGVKIIFADMERTEGMIKNVEKIYNNVKKYYTQKHKDKKAVVAIGQYNKIIGNFKKLLSFHFEGFIKRNQYFELVQFAKEGIWELDFISTDQDVKEEDVLISEITTTIIEHKNITGFVGFVEKYFTFITIDESDQKEFDFIKIPLWDFPPFTDMSYPQMKYTRDNLLPRLVDFNENLEELSADLLKINFNQENYRQIKLLCNEKLSCHNQSIQQVIDESIYLSQLKNNFPDKMGLKFCIGIASAETLIDYYEKTGIVLPYVSSEIKNRVSKQMDLKTCSMFTYFEMYAPNITGIETT